MFVNALVVSLVALLQVPEPVKLPKFEARLLADHETIAPGVRVELAIQLTVERGWHIYHPITLDSGSPTTVAIEAPEGVTFGPLLYPAPALEVQSGLEYLALPHPALILTTVELVEGSRLLEVPMRVTVRGLACKELCVPFEVDADLVLPVETTGEPSAAAKNKDAIAEARLALPEPLARSPYIEGSKAGVSKEEVAVGEGAEIVVTIRVKRGHHIVDRVAGAENLIAARLFIEPLDGLKFDEQVWPDPKIVEIEGVGSVREQRGQFQIRAPFRVIDSEMPGGPVALRLLFTYQCCNDSGTCFPPETAEEVVRFTVQNAEKPRQETARGSIFPKHILGTPKPRAVEAASSAGRSSAVSGDAPDRSGATLLLNLLFGFLGGMILNVTPCVFPVISIKILGFVSQAGEDRRRVLRLGLAFCAGIMVWFWIFGILTGLGEVPLQYPPVTIGLAAVLFVLSLSLFGVYEILLPGAATGKLDEAASREGYIGAFWNGFLATLLGTACTAPFFAGAAAYAATQPQHIALLIFTSAGLGMSAPYLLLSAFPAWLKKLPRPGPWMVTFKQVMGFVIVATVVWLLKVIGKQTGINGLIWTLAFLTFLAFSVWLIGQIRPSWTSGARYWTWASALAVSGFGLWFCLLHMYDLRADGAGAAVGDTLKVTTSGGESLRAIVERVRKSDWEGEIPWQPFRPGLAEELSEAGYTVYVDYTAEWCLNCKTNLVTSLEIDSTRKRMRELGIIPVVADYTNRNRAIREDLLRFGFNGVPMNLVYPAGRPKDVIVLPVLFTPGVVHDALQKAGPSKDVEARGGTAVGGTQDAAGRV